MRLIDYFDRGLFLRPEAAVLEWDGGSISYREADRQVDQIARRLMGELDRPAVPVAVLGPNDHTAFLAVLGIARAEQVWVPVNARATIDETIEVLTTAACEVLFLHPAFGDTAVRISEAVPTLQTVVFLADQAVAGTVSWASWLAGETVGLPAASSDPHRLAVLGFTGGTTGSPKGVMLSDLAFETMTATVLSTVHFTQPPRYLAAAPLTHAAGALAFPILALGGTIVVLAAPAPVAILDAIERFEIDTLFLPPTLIYMLLDAPDLATRDLTSLRHFLYAASPISPTRLVEAMEAFGPVMVQMFGQTEVPMICTALTAAEHQEALSTGATHRLSSAGRPTPFVQMAILDDDGAPVADGKRGEVCVRGNLVMSGYYREPEETARSRRGAWHRTGDIGYFDADGYLYLVDRAKDVIISGGFNVYSAEVEKVVAEHPAVADCIVIGTPDEKWGEVVTAVVELRPGATAEIADLIEHGRTRLSGVKAPKRVEVRTDLPRTAAGKILKRAVREEFWAGRERSI